MTQPQLLFPRITPPSNFIPRRLSLPPNVVPHLISSMLSVPLPWAQVCVPGLEKFTQNELRQMISTLLKTQPELTQFDFSSSSDSFWDLDEDVVLLSYLNSDQSVGVLEFLGDLASILKPTRTAESIESRLIYLMKAGDSEKDEMIEKWTKGAVLERRFFKSLNQEKSVDRKSRNVSLEMERCFCLPWDSPTFSKNSEVEKEVKEIEKSLEFISTDMSQNHELGYFRSDFVQFSMRERYIVIGRGTRDTEVSVNLGFVIDQPCKHISRKQAAVQFLYDGQFYIENIGTGNFRVNGKILQPKQFALLPTNALLDFSGAILMFIPNIAFIKQIMTEFAENKEPRRKQKV
jgi:hypothetical protein